MNGRAGLPDKRGNNADRKRRKLWLLSTPKFGGNGFKVSCVHCFVPCNYDEVEADRIIPGGSYRRDNIQPSCGDCNKKRSNNPDWTYSPNQ